MENRNYIKKCKKRVFAGALAITTMFSGIPGTVTNEPLQVQAEEVKTLSAGEVSALFKQTRTDWRDESIYSIMITRFYDGDTGNNVHCWDDGTAGNPDSDPAWRGDFKGLIEKLDYIKALGFSAVCVTPVAQNASGYDYHGYHSINLSEVDPRYESDGYTYEDFLAACEEKDIKVMQTIVINSTGNFGEENLYPIMEKVKSSANVHDDMIPTDLFLNKAGLSGAEAYYELSAAEQYTARLNTLKSELDDKNIYHHETAFNWNNYLSQVGQLASDSVDLNTENPVVYNYLVDICENYINLGVDAFLIGNANRISRLTYNKAINKAVKEAAENLGKDIEIFGEAQVRTTNAWEDGQYSLSAPFYTWTGEEEDTYAWSDTEDEWETNYNSAVQFTQDYMSTENAKTSDNSTLNGLSYHAPDYSEFSGMNMVDFSMQYNFDNAGNAFSYAKANDRYFNDATWNITRVDDLDYGVGSNDMWRFNGGTDAWAENLTLLFTFRGIPSITYGSEVEFQKGVVIDPGISYPLSQTGRAYFGDYLEGDVTTLGFGEYGNTSGEIANTLNSTLSLHIQTLNRLRQAIPALRKGQYTTDSNYVAGNMAFIRRYTDEVTDSLACVSISGGATFRNLPNGTYIDAVSGDVKEVTNGTLIVSSLSEGNLAVYVWDNDITAAPGIVAPKSAYIKGAAGAAGPQDNLETVIPESISVMPSEVTLKEGETAQLQATVLPKNAVKTVLWTSDKPEIASVVQTGKVTANAEGTAVITAETTNGIKATVSVTVLTGQTEEGGNEESQDTRVYFEKPDYWKDTIYAYAWDSSYNSLLGSWPGTVITDLGNGIYGYELPEGAINIIFSDGGNQTADLVPQTGAIYNPVTNRWTVLVKESVLVEHKTIDGEILLSETMEGISGDAYTTSAKVFEGYQLVSTPENAQGTYQAESDTVTYLYQKEQNENVIEFTSASLSLKDEIHYNLYFTVNGLENISEEDISLLLWDADNTSDETAKDAKITALTDGFKVSTTGIPAKEMGDLKKFVISVKDDEGNLIYSDLLNYSGQKYAMKCLEISEDEALKKVCVALLNYGADAQNYFDYRTEHLMNAELTAEQQALTEKYAETMVAALGTIDDNKVQNFTKSADAFSSENVSVTLGGAFALNCYLTPSSAADSMTLYYWDSDAYEKAEVLTEENASGTILMNQTETEGEFKGTAENIAAKEFDETVYLCGGYEKDGVKYFTGVIPYSVGYYCKMQASDSEAGAIAQGTAVYGYYAKKYFANK